MAHSSKVPLPRARCVWLQSKESEIHEQLLGRRHDSSHKKDGMCCQPQMCFQTCFVQILCCSDSQVERHDPVKNRWEKLVAYYVAKVPKRNTWLLNFSLNTPNKVWPQMVPIFCGPSVQLHQNRERTSKPSKEGKIPDLGWVSRFSSLHGCVWKCGTLVYGFSQKYRWFQ